MVRLRALGHEDISQNTRQHQVIDVKTFVYVFYSCQVYNFFIFETFLL